MAAGYRRANARHVLAAWRTHQTGSGASSAVQNLQATITLLQRRPREATAKANARSARTCSAALRHPTRSQPQLRTKRAATASVTPAPAAATPNAGNTIVSGASMAIIAMLRASASAFGSTSPRLRIALISAFRLNRRPPSGQSWRRRSRLACAWRARGLRVGGLAGFGLA